MKVDLIPMGVSNLSNIKSALEDAGFGVVVRDEISGPGRGNPIVLPGVGSFAAGMEYLTRTGLDAFIADSAGSTPILGICLGMQVLHESSEEFGSHPGLGLISGFCRPLSLQDREHSLTFPVFNTGWRRIHRNAGVAHWLDALEGSKKSPYFYFNHSFVVETRSADVVAEFVFPERGPAVVNQGGLTGMQFHPELSGEVGIRCLRLWRESL